MQNLKYANGPSLSSSKLTPFVKAPPFDKASSLQQSAHLFFLPPSLNLCSSSLPPRKTKRLSFPQDNFKTNLHMPLAACCHPPPQSGFVSSFFWSGFVTFFWFRLAPSPSTKFILEICLMASYEIKVFPMRVLPWFALEPFLRPKTVAFLR